MKKLIAILAIAIVLVGAVFADEAHNITIQADVTGIDPAFRLVAGTGNSAVATNSPTTGNPVAFGAATDLTKAYGDTGFNLDAGGSFTVYAKLANLPKQVQAYSLIFSDGVFSVKRNTAAGFLAPSSVAVTKGSNGTGVIDMAGGGTTTVSNPKVTGTTKPTVTCDAVTFKLDGTTVTVADYLLATAVYTYPADTTIDPTAANTYYEATITLTVQAN